MRIRVVYKDRFLEMEEMEARRRARHLNSIRSRRNPDIENDTISILFLAHGREEGGSVQFRQLADYRPVFVVSKINREPG